MVNIEKMVEFLEVYMSIGEEGDGTIVRTPQKNTKLTTSPRPHRKLFWRDTPKPSKKPRMWLEVAKKRRNE